MKKKKVCVITGARSDYVYLELIIKKIEVSNKLDLSLLVTGMHLLKIFGNTIENIKENGVKIKKIIPMYDEKDITQKFLGKHVGKAIINFTDALIEEKPNILLVLGDRFEALAAVIAASTLSIPIAHIHGGDSAYLGQIDEQIRHAITKFSHIHFPATYKSAERIRLMGEEEWRIHMVGSPSIDTILSEYDNLLSREEIYKYFGFNSSKKLVLCLQHPYIIEAEEVGIQMKTILQVLKDLNLQSILIYPNNDPGSHLIIKEIKLNKNNPYFRVFKNLERKIYLSLLKNIDLLIGNSSGGLIESPIFKLPVINIGDRNKGRETSENVINVNSDYEEIKINVYKALYDPNFKKICDNVKNPYGDGTSTDKIINILENLEINDRFLKKRITYEV